MSNNLKVGLILSAIIILFGSVFLWKFSGYPYYKIHLIGTEFKKNSDELSYANEKRVDEFYLIKRYKYSEHNMALGYGGGSSYTTDFYVYGVADKNKNTLIETKYEFISSKLNSQKEPIIFGLPYVEKGDEKMIYYKVTNTGLELIDEKASW